MKKRKSALPPKIVPVLKSIGEEKPKCLCGAIRQIGDHSLRCFVNPESERQEMGGPNPVKTTTTPMYYQREPPVGKGDVWMAGAFCAVMLLLAIGSFYIFKPRPLPFDVPSTPSEWQVKCQRAWRVLNKHRDAAGAEEAFKVLDR